MQDRFAQWYGFARNKGKRRPFEPSQTKRRNLGSVMV